MTTPLRLSGNHPAGVPQWVSLRNAVEEAWATIEARSGGAASPRLRCDVAEGHAVWAVRRTIDDTLALLLAQARRASEAASGSLGRPEVTVTSVQYEDAVEIEVADSGTTPARDRSRAGADPSRVAKLVSHIGGSLQTMDCPEGGVAVTLRLPRVVSRRAAA